MKVFKFSLQAVLDNAVTEKNDCIVKLKEVLEKIRTAEHDKEILFDDIQVNESKLRDYFNSSSFKQVKIYIDELLFRIEILNEEIDRLNIIRIERLEDLKKAKIKCSAFEKIKDKKYMQYLDEIKKFEEREIEEFINYNCFAKVE